MAFGPAWRQSCCSSDSDALLPLVRSAAQQLLADLERAERLTGHWRNERLADAAVDMALSACLNRLAETGCWGEANRLPSSELWRIAGPPLERGTLQTHARSKPYGYAGDHEMLTRIWERSCCEDPLGAAFDRYFLRQAAPEAVRARIEQTAAALAVHCLRAERRQYDVVSVGSGPAIDLSEGLNALPPERRATARVRLLDLDPRALDVAAGRIAPLVADGALSPVRTNLYRLPQGSNGARVLGRPAFLVCSGLFDYLADEPAVAMLRLFWEQLGEGGLLLVGNFAPHNPTRGYMEWFGNWYLLYRTAEDLRRLAVAAGIPPHEFSVGCDRTGNDLFLMAGKSPS